MVSITVTVMGDGPSDRALVRHVEWIFEQLAPDFSLAGMFWAENCHIVNGSRRLADRMRFVIAMYPCDLLLVHRDAEKQAASERVQEISEAIRLAATGSVHVPIVPVRMTEAWLLFDLDSIRAAAGNPNGRQQLSLPPSNQIESLADPKQVLYGLLKAASGLSGRRLKKFREVQAAGRVADYIQDFSPLRQLGAFQEFESQLIDTLRGLGGDAE